MSKSSGGVPARPTRGRRPGAPDTGAQVLDAARKSFAQVGFAGTTIRAVASAAGVDPALVHHYFGTKDKLFLAALEFPVDPRERLAPVVAGDPEQAGEGLVRALLSVWDDPQLQPQLLALARTVLSADGRRFVTEGFIPAIIGPVLAPLASDHPEVRIPLVASQLVGLIATRYVLGVPPMTSMPADDVAAYVGPTVQRYLTGDLGGLVG